MKPLLILILLALVALAGCQKAIDDGPGVPWGPNLIDNYYTENARRRHEADSICTERGHIWKDETAWYGKPLRAWTTHTDAKDYTVVTHWTRRDTRSYRCMRCEIIKMGEPTAKSDTVWKRPEFVWTHYIACDTSGIVSENWTKLRHK